MTCFFEACTGAEVAVGGCRRRDAEGTICRLRVESMLWPEKEGFIEHREDGDCGVYGSCCGAYLHSHAREKLRPFYFSRASLLAMLHASAAAPVPGRAWECGPLVMVSRPFSSPPVPAIELAS